MQYYSFHIGDYTTVTVHLSPMEDLAYRRLLDLYYLTEEPIPNDIPWVSRRLRLGSEEIESILKEFFFLTDNGWENDRCNADIDAFHAHIEKQRANGKKGGRPRKKPKKTHRLPTENPPKSDGVPNTKPPSTHNPSPITHNNTPKPPQGGISGYTADFEDFWKAYERKGSKINAFKRWKKLSAEDKHDALAAIEDYFLENPDKQFRKDAEGYLNGKLFESVLERKKAGTLIVPRRADTTKFNERHEDTDFSNVYNREPGDF